MKNNVCLVLGAGASNAYGYPLGAGLKERILKLCISNPETAASAGVALAPAYLRAFGEQFSQSSRSSIDAFLAHRTEFSDLGKELIACVLLRCEHQRPIVHPSNGAEDLYGYLFERLCSDPWDSLNLSGVSIVSFNYDRSLEMAFVQKMTAAYGVSEADALRKLKAMEIVHVYGCLGGSNSWDYQTVPYGQEPASWTVTLAAGHLKVIPDVRRDETSESFKKAQDLLRAADGVAFLGFAFDELNVERLGGTATCNWLIQRPNGSLHRQVVATTYGMKRAESEYARRRTRGDVAPSPQTEYEYMPLTCVELLRETGFLLG